jgi:hypothetical protein
MLLNIKPTISQGCDCFENLLVTISKHFNRNFELMFSDSWNFDYLSIEPNSSLRIGDRIAISNNSIKLLTQYHGIQINGMTTFNINTFLSTLEIELSQNKPVILLTDSYYTPWHPEYQKEHFNHTFLVFGFNEKDYSFHCFDGWPYTEDAILTLSNLEKGIEGYITCTVQNYNNTEPGWKELLINSINKHEINQTFDKIRQFGNDIKNNLDIVCEMKDHSFISSPIIGKIRKVSMNRMQFSTFLAYLADKYNVSDLHNLSEKFNVLASRWKLISLSLSKVVIKLDYTLKMIIYEKIIEAAKFEEELADEIKEIVFRENDNHTVIPSCKPTLIKYEKYDTLCLSLDKYYNNNGIGNVISYQCKANFTINQFFFPDDSFKTTSLNVNNMIFRLPRIRDDLNDNISCNGELISEDIGNYNTLMLLGCAEFGDYTDIVKIYYADGNTEDIYISFTDWNKPPLFNEKVALIGKCVQKVDSSAYIYKEKVHIFAKEYNLSNNNEIIGIQLPDCPKIHLFAISLGRRINCNSS